MNRVAFTIQSGQRISKGVSDQQFENGVRRADANSCKIEDRYERDDNRRPLRVRYFEGEDAWTNAPVMEKMRMMKSIECYATK